MPQFCSYGSLGGAYLRCEVAVGGGLEGRVQRAQLVHQAAQRPHVALIVVLATLYDLLRVC